MIVDDEPNAAEVMAEHLSSICRPSTATSVKAAITLLAKNKFNLLVTDLYLDGGDGIGLIRRARHCQPNLECVVITGYPSSKTLTQARNLGVSNYVVKPFAYDQLIFICNRSLQDKEYKHHDLQKKRAGYYDIKDFETSHLRKEYLETLLKRFHGNVTRSARIARMFKTGFYRHIRALGIDLEKLRVQPHQEPKSFIR